MKYCAYCGKEIADDAIYCSYCGTSTMKVTKEEFSISSDDLVKKVKELIHEGNVTRIIVENEKEQTLLEIPVTVGFVGLLIAPWLAGLGVIAAMVTRCRIIVERREP